jgi:hypothetical protein
LLFHQVQLHKHEPGPPIALSPCGRADWRKIGCVKHEADDRTSSRISWIRGVRSLPDFYTDQRIVQVHLTLDKLGPPHA